MKIRYDFVTNSSSTSFVIISDGEFNLKDFVEAVGIDENSMFIDIYKELFECFKSDMTPLEEIYSGTTDESLEQFIKSKFWKSGNDILPKVIAARKEGKQIFIGKLDSETNDTQTFFCTDEFIISSNKLYIDYQEDGW